MYLLPSDGCLSDEEGFNVKSPEEEESDNLKQLEGIKNVLLNLLHYLREANFDYLLGGGYFRIRLFNEFVDVILNRNTVRQFSNKRFTDEEMKIMIYIYKRFINRNFVNVSQNNFFIFVAKNKI